jgi:hypothetical protein
MTLLAVLSGIVGAVVLTPTGLGEALAAVSVNVVLAWLFYRGALASAAAYGQVLVSIRDYVDEESPTGAAES